jgi:hypothetical protein
LKKEKLWRLHDYTEDKKIKLASLEFDGYALRWWDSIVHTHQENNELPIMTWRHMKEVMRARFVPHNYLRSVFDKLQQLKQGSMSINEYYMEMEMLLQRARVREPLEQTLQHFLHGLKYNIKSIVRHHRYCDMNELLHHAREAEAQFAKKLSLSLVLLRAAVSHPGLLHPHQVLIQIFVLLRRRDLMPIQRNPHLLLVVRVQTCLQHVIVIWSVILVVAKVILNGIAPIEKS